MSITMEESCSGTHFLLESIYGIGLEVPDTFLPGLVSGTKKLRLFWKRY